MDDSHETRGSIFEALPEVLLLRILTLCSPMYSIRAAASCQLLHKAHKEVEQLNKHLTPRVFVRISGSTDESKPLFPEKANRLVLKLKRMARCEEASVYRELQARLDCTRTLGVEHLSTVQELAIQHYKQTADDLHLPAQHCMQQLLQLLPCLKTLWIGNMRSSQLFLDCKHPHALASICRASLHLKPYSEQLVHLPTILPNLDTLCIRVDGSMDASWLEPLSQLSQLTHLSLSCYIQTTSPNMQQLMSLRHLKLYDAMICTSGINSLSALQQLDSLSLHSVKICLEPLDDVASLAALTVSALTLRHVHVSGMCVGRYAGLYTGKKTVTAKHAKGPCWPRLKKVYLQVRVSEKTLQALQLPHPAAAGLKVELKAAAFDDFVSDIRSSVQPTAAYVYNTLSPELTYVADVTPLLGPVYLASAQIDSLSVTGIRISVLEAIAAVQKAHVPIKTLAVAVTCRDACREADCIAFPALQKLELSCLQISEDGWCNLLFRCSFLRLVSIYHEREGDGDGENEKNMRAAATRLGITVKKLTFSTFHLVGNNRYDYTF